MASNRVLAKSINMPFLQSNNKFIYVSLLVVLSFFLLLDRMNHRFRKSMKHNSYNSKNTNTKSKETGGKA